MKMKNFSVATIVLLIFAAVLVFYLLSYYQPAQNTVTQLNADLAVSKKQLSTYSKYISDPSALQTEIDLLQKEIDELHESGYVNDSTVGMAINDAIQRYKIQLSSISLGNRTSVRGYSALPINMSISGSYDNIMDFISHFENHSEGSYLVQGVSMSISGSNCSVSLTLYLCTP